MLKYFSLWFEQPVSLIRYDPGGRFRSLGNKRLARAIFGALVTLLAMVPLRIVIDQFSQTAGPYALIHPTVMVATLFGRREAGFAAMVTAFLWALGTNIETAKWGGFTMPTEMGRFWVNVFAATVVLLLADFFRRAAEAALVERDAEIERRRMLAIDLEHRTKNNFAMVSSLLSLQRRRSDNPDTADALDVAIRRIQTFAGAYAELRASEDGGELEMSSYVGDLVHRIGAGAFDPAVLVTASSDSVVLPRETAVAIGLFINEALTNAAKYAFAEGEAGAVTVTFSGNARQWQCTVSNTGEGRVDGAVPPSASGSGLGTGLMEAFAKQAGAVIDRPAVERGFAIRLHTPLPAAA